MQNPTGLLDILAITAPIFILVGIGYLAVLRNVLPRDGMRFLAAFLVNIAVPALLFKSISTRKISEVIQIDFMLVYGGGSLTAFLIVFFISRRLLGKDITSAAIYGMGGAFSNTLMIGYPLATGLVGSAALVPFALVLLIENFLMMPLTLALADIGQHKEKGFFKVLPGLLATVFKNPLILAILLGVVFSIFNIEVPAVANTVIDLLSRVVVGLGLFVIGGMLVGFKYSGHLKDVSLIMLGKLLLHPLLVFLLLLLVPVIDLQYKIAGVMLASAPMFGIYTVIGERYGMGGICAAASVPTTVISFVSITVIAWFVNLGSVFH
jgi:malonate transporter and related proteins